MDEMADEDHKPMNTSLVNKLSAREVIITGDGSFTLHVSEVDETYHSRHGAMQESMHVFIENGLRVCTQPKVKILEIGLGTGLNAMLTFLHSQSDIEYTALEPFPLHEDIISQIRHQWIDHQGFFDLIHQENTLDALELSSSFRFSRTELLFQDWQPNSSYDIIYFDAFGPRVEPSLWTLEIMKKCYEVLSPGGIWVSYCAKGEVRRNLHAAGFEVERLQGPPGKREMLRAKK
jgi:tRNA U34 5-methylaminomethyl-2-thiouridine-forming methyltransferase MnmC